jgi:hypothetical protein
MASDSKEYEGYSKLTQIQQNRKKKISKQWCMLIVINDNEGQRGYLCNKLVMLSYDLLVDR